MFDTEALVGHLVSAGSVYALLAGHRGGLFPDGMFADLDTDDNKIVLDNGKVRKQRPYH